MCSVLLSIFLYIQPPPPFLSSSPILRVYFWSPFFLQTKITPSPFFTLPAYVFILVIHVFFPTNIPLSFISLFASLFLLSTFSSIQTAPSPLSTSLRIYSCYPRFLPYKHPIPLSPYAMLVTLRTGIPDILRSSFPIHLFGAIKKWLSTGWISFVVGVVVLFRLSFRTRTNWENYENAIDSELPDLNV